MTKFYAMEHDHNSVTTHLTAALFRLNLSDVDPQCENLFRPQTQP